MKETQLLKGVLEGCVLQVIAQKEIYGYELSFAAEVGKTRTYYL